MSIDSEEFYELMQTYRWAEDVEPASPGQPTAQEAYQAVIDYIERYVCDELIENEGRL